jgi:ComF family protein
MPVAALCAKCLDRTPAFDRAWTPFVRHDPVKNGVHGLKYRADFQQARVMASLMAERLCQRAEPLPGLLIPVPLAWTRLLLRGHNQAVELARVLSRLTGIPVDARAARLRRRIDNQIGKTAAQRRHNLRNAFSVERDLGGRHVALIDDVMTTGATLDALAVAARRAGAARIEAWALLREP